VKGTRAHNLLTQHVYARVDRSHFIGLLLCRLGDYYKYGGKVLLTSSGIWSPYIHVGMCDVTAYYHIEYSVTT
jgi:hypothetical protein